jgi:hypothetical protein
MPGTSLVAAQQPQASSPRSKGLVGSGPSDVQLRRDNLGSSSGGGAQVLTPSYALLQQLQLQQLGGSSGPGSDTGGSVQHQSHQEEAQKPAKRGRGRQRKNTGVETAQQVCLIASRPSSASSLAHHTCFVLGAAD